MRILILVVSLWLATSSLQGKIVFEITQNGNTDIYKMDSDGNNQVRLTNHPKMDLLPTWSPNGQQIAFHSYRHGRNDPDIFVMDADGRNLRQIVNHPAYDGAPHWHPNGKRIAFMRGKDLAYLYTIDIDGNNLKLITEGDFIGRIRWAPDGERIAFRGVIGESRGIFVIDADGRNLSQVLKPAHQSGLGLGDWSPDGKKILYTEIIAPLAHGGNWEDSIVIATLHGPNREVIKFEPVILPPNPLLRVEGQGWGADGKSIIITGKIGRWDIYRFRLDTHELIQLTNSPVTDFAPHEWNPRLSVPSQQGLLPQVWGHLKAVALRR